MNVAVLSDIHGNAYALREVLKEVKKHNVEKLLILGDVVGYYYEPHIVMSMLDDWNTVMIRGNHEVLLSDIIQGRLSHKEAKKKYGSGLECALNQLSKKQLKDLIELPDTAETQAGSSIFCMFHGSPMEPNQYLYPDSSNEVLNQCDVGGDFVLTGHSHYEFIYRNNHSLLVNAGSVGQSKTKGGVAVWILINSISKTVRIMHTPYPVEKLIRDVEVRDSDIPYLKTLLQK